MTISTFGRLRLAAGSALTALGAHPVRTALAACGVVMGTAAYAAGRMLSDGVYELARVELARSGRGGEIRIVPLRARRIDLVEVAATTAVRFEQDDIGSLRRTLAAGAIVWIQDSGAVVSQIGARDRGISVIGLASDEVAVWREPLLVGRTPYFEAGAASDSDRVLLSFRLASLLFPKEPKSQAVDRVVGIANRRLRIVGVVDSTAKEKRLVIWMRRETARALDPKVEEVLVVRPSPSGPVDSVHALVARIDRWITLARPHWKGTIHVSAPDAGILESMRRRAELLRIALGSFSILIMLVAATGIANVILASALERTREIGIRKAVGARFRDIFLQFLAEALTLAGLSGAVGVAAGTAGASLIAWYVRWDTGQPIYPRLHLDIVLSALCLAILAGIVAGVMPAVHAARIAPIDAIETE